MKKTKTDTHTGKRTIMRTVLTRARIIFPILFLLVLAASTGTVVYGMKTGELYKRLVEPIKKITSDISRIFDTALMEEKKPKAETGRWKTYLYITPTAKTTTRTYRYSWQYTSDPQPTYNNSAYESALKEQQEWANKNDADRQAWIEESRRKYNEFSQQSQSNFENAQKQAQQNMEQFKAENQKKLEEWKKQHGF